MTIQGAASIAAIAAFAASAPVASAQEGVAGTLVGASAGRSAATLTVEEADDAIDGTLSADLTTHYFFRGLIQEDQGVIFQPAIDLNVGLWEGEGDVTSFGLLLGQWNSLHSGPTGSSGSASNSPSSWYESDFYVGANLDFAAGFNVAANWVSYTSPNGSYDTINEINVAVGFDDSGWYGESGFGGLAPTVTLALETDGQTDQGAEPSGTDEGIFVGFGVAPEFSLGKLGEGEAAPEMTLAVPFNVGFSFSDYYEDGDGDDDRFGYWDVGGVVSMPLSSVPTRFGDWTLTAGVTAVFLSGNQKDLNHDEGFELVGTVGLSIGF